MGGDPVNNSDPFGLDCASKDGGRRACRVTVSPEGRWIGTGAKLEDLTQQSRERIQAIADRAQVDLGINAAKNGTHRDPGHAAGTAVDIGYINGADIGRGTQTAPGMEALSLRVQQAAADLGDLKERGNLGPSGKFMHGTGPLPINDPTIRAQHKNHIHLSWIFP